MKLTAYDVHSDRDVVRYIVLRWDGKEYEQMGMDFNADESRSVIARGLWTQLRPAARAKGAPVRFDHFERRLKAAGIIVHS